MGHYITVSVGIKDAEGAAGRLLDEAVERHLEGNISDLSFGPVTGSGWALDGNTKYEPEGVEDFAEAVSGRFPGAVVAVRIEWDTRDADEAGSIEYSYIGGQRCNDRESGLVPDDLAESIARVRAALSGSGDLAAAARWLTDGLEGTRVPVPDVPVEPRRVEKVTVTDEWGHDYSDLFAAAFDYSEVTERHGDELLIATGWRDDRRVACAADISGIVHRWIEHAEAATGTVYTAEWMGGWDAYVLPYWNGEHVGFYAIHGNDDGNGSIPFDQIIDALSLGFTVAWSDGTTDGDTE